MVDADYLGRILEHLETFAALHSFPGVDAINEAADAIAAAHPGRVRRAPIGRSRLGEPLHEYVVGDESLPQVLIVGGVHPNEPIGFHTALRLLGDVAEETGPAADLAACWRIIPCIDPDGTRLNESWFAAPGDRIDYARGFYRPAPAEQVEWSFPLDYRGVRFTEPIPETRALMHVIDTSRPALTVGLHNGELGGVYYYLTPGLRAAVDALHAIPRHLGLPLDAGEPETPELDPLAEAVFPAVTARAQIDALIKRGIDPAPHIAGGGMGDYLEPLGADALVAELPYWSHPDSDDTTPTAEGYAEVLRRKAAGLDELAGVLGAALDLAGGDLRIDSQLRRGAVTFTRAMSVLSAAERERADGADPRRRATVAEVFSNADLVRCFRLRFGSMLARALRAEVASGASPPAVRRALGELEEHLERWYEEARSVRGLRTWPIERLVGVQYGTILAAARTAINRGRRGP